MKKSNGLSYFLKILWVVGLIILAIISFNYENQLQQTATETFNFIPVIWSKLFMSIIFGLYISLLFVKKWSFNINPSLLWCVALPCIILSFAFPILVTLSSVDRLPEMMKVPYFFWATKNLFYEYIWNYSRFDNDP